LNAEYPARDGNAINMRLPTIEDTGGGTPPSYDLGRTEGDRKPTPVANRTRYLEALVQQTKKEKNRQPVSRLKTAKGEEERRRVLITSQDRKRRKRRGVYPHLVEDPSPPKKKKLEGPSEGT